MKFLIGSYVEVVQAPDPWESSGESDEDRSAFIGHIGLVVEGPTGCDGDDLYLIRFPSHKEEATGQRNIERSALRLVSSPIRPVPDTCLEG